MSGANQDSIFVLNFYGLVMFCFAWSASILLWYTFLFNWGWFYIWGYLFGTKIDGTLPLKKVLVGIFISKLVFLLIIILKLLL